MKELKVKYFNEEMKTKEEYQIKKIIKGDWIDLRVAEAYVTSNDEESIKAGIKGRLIDTWSGRFSRIYYEKDQVIIMRLGVAMELPVGYKANLSPRGSTFASYGLMLANSMGCIDYVFKGDTDEWLAIYYATRAGYITRFDRACQFEITEQMPDLNIITVDTLGGEDRGGHCTTGNK
jgi:dUTP pyrophosphatase